MSLNLSSLTSSILNLMSKNNTTTAAVDVSSGLTKRVQLFKIADPEQYPVPNNMYPSVMLQLKNKDSEFSQIGNSARREVNLAYQITPIIYAGMATQQSGAGGQDIALLELYRLSSNIERLIRNNPQLSLTSQVLWSDCIRVDYDGVKGDSTYVQTAKINLNVKILDT